MRSSGDPARRLSNLGESESSHSFGNLRAAQWVSRALDSLVKTALPPVCAGCGTSGYWLCPLCDQTARRIDLATTCRRCGRPAVARQTCERCDGWDDALSACRSVYVFDGVVRKLIHYLKYGGEFARSEWCGIEMSRLIVELGWKPDLIVPVPLHRSRLRSRGYNQSAKIASSASVLLGIPWGNILTRTRATVSQVGLDAEMRHENVLGAFSCSHDLSGLSILLIDDVVTTGATLTSCADACRSAGAADVRAVSVATGL